MLKSDKLLEAFSGVREEYILELNSALGPEKVPVHRAKKLLRTVLIAAVIAALMCAAALAAGLLGRKERLAELPDTEDGREQYTVIPNGFKSSPTYMGSLEWWTAVAEYDKAHPDSSYDPDKIEGSDEDFFTARLYYVKSQDMLTKLREIADKYSLSLYTEYIAFAGMEDFSAYSGVKDFTDAEIEHIGGYIFSDGSFKAETTLELDNKSISCTVQRVLPGSIYPFRMGGAVKSQYEEIEYKTSLGCGVVISPFSENSSYISYVSPGGDSFIELHASLFTPGAELSVEDCKKLADSVDFEALCRVSSVPAEIIEVDRGSEDNRDAVEKLRDFAESGVYKAGEEFQAFFTAEFYDAYFKGCYGMEGYEDIDEMLLSLSEKYSLRYPKFKTLGNEFSDSAEVYDNGAWRANFKAEKDGRTVSECTLHYIPKDALYTGFAYYVDFELYRRVWTYETASGDEVLLFSEGPDKTGGAWAYYESDSAYVLMSMSSSGPNFMEEAAECVDWSALK